jgi:hypothetical protein
MEEAIDGQPSMFLAAAWSLKAAPCIAAFRLKPRWTNMAKLNLHDTICRIYSHFMGFLWNVFVVQIDLFVQPVSHILSVPN